MTTQSSHPHYAVLAPAHPDSTVHRRFPQRAALHEFVPSPTSSTQCDPIANQTHLQVISRIIPEEMMLEAPAATGGNAGQSTQPAGMPMVADQTSPPRKLLRHHVGGSGQDLSAVQAGGKPRCTVTRYGGRNCCRKSHETFVLQVFSATSYRTKA